MTDSEGLTFRSPAAPDMSADILLGASAIAAFMGMRPRQLYHAAEMGYLPTFRIGGILCARRSTLNRWITELEQEVIGRQS